MRCSAPIRPSSLLIRSRHSPADPSCLRAAVDHGLCLQHSRVREQIEQRRRAMYDQAREQMMSDHRRILNRILAIPPRD